MSARSRIFAVVSRIPRGRVATYGQVAELAGIPGQARLVGYALSALDRDSRIPWHRVVNATGRISTRSQDTGSEVTQAILLRREGVRFGPRGSLSLEKYRWRPQRESPP
jgi:methylated-DNA-protein-cysteine methyltransferase-like protein